MLARLQAIAADARATEVIAGAGTGKTRVLVARVAWLVATGRARPREVCALAFMNDAAGQIARRLDRAVGPVAARQVFAGTGHRLAAALLHHHAARFGRGPGFSIPAPTAGALRGDEAELFRLHHRHLLGLVGRDVNARPEVIEDACAFAWLELVARQPERTNTIGWLRVVARREAIRLVRHDRRGAGLSRDGVDPRAAAAGQWAGEAAEALRALASLPARKRAVLTLQVAGHSYPEIGERMHMTPRTVQRQLLRARAAVRRERDSGALAA